MRYLRYFKQSVLLYLSNLVGIITLKGLYIDLPLVIFYILVIVPFIIPVFLVCSIIIVPINTYYFYRHEQEEIIKRLQGL
jgi:hypothetical protein